MKMRSLFFVKAVQFTYPEPSSFILLSHGGYWKISLVPDQKKKKKKRTNIYEITHETDCSLPKTLLISRSS